MAGKKSNGKTKARRAAPKATQKRASNGAKKSAKPKSSGAKKSAKAPPKSSGAKKPAKASPKPKRAKKPAAVPSVLAAEPAIDMAVPDLAVDAIAGDETGQTGTKRGALARLAGGVGSLFARMTGKKPAPEPEPEPAMDQTMILASSDLIETAEPPPIPKRKS